MITKFESFKEHNFLTRIIHYNKNKILKTIITKNYKKEKFSVLDIGAGLGDFYKHFNKEFNFNYYGVESNVKFVDEMNVRYGKNNNFEIINKNIQDCINQFADIDLILCLDILEHINLEDRFELLRKISKLNFKILYINVPNEIGPAIFIKNFGSRIMNYKRDWEYSFLDTIKASFYMIDKIDHHTTLHKGFDWRHLRYILHYYFNVKTYTNLNSKIPKIISPTISFLCKKK